MTQKLNYRIGLDVGVGSVGWAAIQDDKNGHPIKILDLNSYLFPSGEDARGNSPAQNRREARSARRLKRRHQFRKLRVRNFLVKEVGLIKPQELTEVLHTSLYNDLTALRSQALDHPLNNPALFRIFYYFAGHRGFQSTRKAELKDSEAKGMLAELNKTETALKGYRTLGEYYAKAPQFKGGFHNKGYLSGYSGTAKRAWLIKEITLIWHTQHDQFHNPLLTEDKLQAYLKLFKQQRSFDEGPANGPFSGGIAKLVGKDPFNKTELRAAKATDSFVKANLLIQLNNLKYLSRDPVNHKAISFAINGDNKTKIVKACLFKKKKVTLATITKILGLPKDTHYNLQLKGETPGKHILIDLTANTNLHKILKGVNVSSKEYDQIADILTKFKTDSTRLKKLAEVTALKPLIQSHDKRIDDLLLETPSQFGHLSVKTLRQIMPSLKQGFTYDQAMQAAGHQFSTLTTSLDDIRAIANPVVKRSVLQTIKVVKHLIARYGNPDYICLEMARELGKTKLERNQILANNLNYQNKYRDDQKKLADSGFGQVNATQVKKYELWKQQNHVDIYSGQPISIKAALTAATEIDHIVPYSLTLNDSLNNKVLTTVKNNRQKGQRVPMDYLSGAALTNFQTLVSNLFSNKKISYTKLNNLLSKKTPEHQDILKTWRTSAVNDTGYINKLLNNYFKNSGDIHYHNPQGAKKNHLTVVVINGRVTSYMRKIWRLNKNRADGDLHHAQDAAVIAVTTPGTVQKIVRYYQFKETGRPLTHKLYAEQPFEGFTKQLKVLLADDPLSMNQQLHAFKDGTDLKPKIPVWKPDHHIAGKVNGDTRYSGKLISQNKVLIRKPITSLMAGKDPDGRDVLYYSSNGTKKANPKTVAYNYLTSGKLVNDKLCELIKQKDPKELSGANAFPDGVAIFEHNGQTVRVTKVRLIKTMNINPVNVLKVKSNNSVMDLANNAYLNIFWNKAKKKYEFGPEFSYQIHQSKMTGKPIQHFVQKDFKNIILQNKNQKLLFKLFKRDLVELTLNKELVLKPNTDSSNQNQKIIPAGDPILMHLCNKTGIQLGFSEVRGRF